MGAKGGRAGPHSVNLHDVAREAGVHTGEVARGHERGSRPGVSEWTWCDAIRSGPRIQSLAGR
jgi:hypothetical protein